MIEVRKSKPTQLQLIAELFNAIADLTEGAQYGAKMKLDALAPTLQEMLDEENKQKENDEHETQ